MQSYPLLEMLASAELLFLLVRSREIIVLAKNHRQRTAAERLQIGRGLRKSVFLEGFLFVPASTVLAYLILNPLLKPLGSFSRLNDPTFFCLLGVISYGFPFAALRRFITAVAFQSLQRFSEELQNSNKTVRAAKE